MDSLIDLILAFLSLRRREAPVDGLFRLARWTGAAFLVIGWGLLMWLSTQTRTDDAAMALAPWALAVPVGAFSGPMLVWLASRRRRKDWYPVWLVLLVIGSAPGAILIWGLPFCFLIPT